MELDKITINTQSSIRMEAADKIIYFDPYEIGEEQNDADVVFVTHGHFDHFSPADIDLVRKENTIFVIPESVRKDVEEKLEVEKTNVIYVVPNKSYELMGMSFRTIPAYNLEKEFHKKSENWVGYILALEGKRYYIAGDTDVTPEMMNVKADVFMIPVGGHFTMDYVEAAKMANELRPKTIIPMHFGTVIGDPDFGKKFEKLVVPGVQIEQRLFLDL